MSPTPWIPPIPGLHRRDPEHRYWLGEVEFPVSVTGVLSCQKSAYAMERIEATRETWEPRGNQTHRALELFLGLCCPGGDGAGAAELQELAAGDHADWIGPLITHPRWDQVQVIASERPTCCLRRRVAGTFDCAYVDATLPTPERPSWASGGPPRVLADLKTLGEAGSTYSTAAQLGAYMALEATHGLWYDYGQTIWARPGKATFSPLYSRSGCLLAWAGAWATWRALHPGGRARISL
jgi:hypothetical protein